MKKSTIYSIALCLLLSSCFEDDGETKLVTLNCEAFDFGVRESEWIILPQGTDYAFLGQGKTLNFTSDYSTTEAYTLQYERRIRLIPFPDGQVRDCSSSHNSFHESTDKNTVIWYTIGNNGERVDMGMGFDDMAFSFEIVNDTITGGRTGFSDDDFEPYIFKNFSSLSLSGRNFENVVRITNQNTELQPRQIYLAKNLGLVAFEKNDTLWLRN